MWERGIPICLKTNFLLRDNDRLSNSSALNVLSNGYADNVLINMQHRFECWFRYNPHVPGGYHFQFLQQAHKIYCLTMRQPYNKTREALARQASFHRPLKINLYVPAE